MPAGKAIWTRVRVGKTAAANVPAARPEPPRDNLAEQWLDVGRLRRRPRRLARLVADFVGDRAENAAADVRRLEDRGYQMGGGRLAVGAGDSDHPHLAGRAA